MEKEEEVDRRRDRKTVSKSGHWTLPARLGQLATGQDGTGLLRINCSAPPTRQD